MPLPWRGSRVGRMLARMVTAFIALGSNLGRRKSSIAAAITHLDALPQSHVTTVAPFLETQPVDAPAGSGSFINTVAALETSLPAADLLQELLRVERELGRDRTGTPEIPLVRNGPRAIDLDLLLYGEQRIQSSQLTIPHPRMHLRGFVLEPLAEIAPEVVHPSTGKTIRELLADWRAAEAAHFAEERA
jgi:2-amino-4-hydroxy-6-hydroxymethyldihydropteridine diphosphokinase